MADDVLGEPVEQVDHQVFLLDGVEVHHFPSADTVCHAELVFAVGERNESLPTQGTLHALEHLVMDTARHNPIDLNASVGLHTTEFTATGSPELVGQFLRQVCLALVEPPVQNLSREAKVLAAELDSTDRPEGPLLVARYGWRDLGLADAPGPGPERLSPAVVVDVAERWFTAASSVLVVDGPLPADLSLPLRQGPAPARTWPPIRHWSRPHALTIGAPVCAVSLILPPRTASQIGPVAVEVIHGRVREALRHQGGLSYTVDYALAPGADRYWDLLVYAEPPPEHLAAATRCLVQTLRTLLATGPTQIEMDQAVARVREGAMGRDAFVAQIQIRAVAARGDVDLPPPDPSRLDALAVDDLTAYLNRIADDVLYLASAGCKGVLAELGLPPTTIEPPAADSSEAGRTFRPPVLARLLNSAARASRVTLTDDGLILADQDLTQRLRWSEVAGAMCVAEDEMVVFGLDGSAIPIGGALYGGGERLIEAVLAAVPAELIYRQSAQLRDPDES